LKYNEFKDQFLYIIMPKHKKGNNNTRRLAPKKLPIEYAKTDISQYYGYISEVLGNCHFKINTINQEVKIASLSGTVKRNGKIKTGDFVLIEPLTDDTNAKYQVIFKYTPEQKKVLEKEGCLTQIINPAEKTQETIVASTEVAFVFESEEKAEREASVMQKEMEIINDLFIDDI
jgi:initiation factor 1A